MWKKLIAFMLLTGPFLGASSVRGKVTCRGVKDSAHVVVYLASTSPSNGSHSLPSKDAVMDQVNLTFQPHVLPVLKGTRVAFPNSDEVRHNVFSPSRAKRFNLGTYPKGMVKHVVFDQTGEVALLCNVHAEMSAYIVVTDTPHFAVTDKDGHFEIVGVPPGEYLIKTWHEKLPPIARKITVEKSGSVEMNLEMKR